MKQKKIKRRILSVLLTLVMAVSTFTGIVPGTSMTAKATDYAIIQVDGGYLKKGGVNWSVNSNVLELGAGNYQLGSNITTSNTIVVTGNVTLDLNGYGILNESTVESFGSVIKVGDDTNAGYLTLTDSKTTEIPDHYLTMSGYRATAVSGTGTESEVNSSGSGVIKVNGGYIAGGYCYNYSDCGAGVCIVKGTFTMNSGNIVGNYSHYKSGGVCACDGTTFTMSGGKITGNYANENGAGVVVTNTGNATLFNMEGGYITGNMTSLGSESVSSGGGVYVECGSNSTFTMTGGHITGNITSQRGSGVVVGGTFEMTGGEVTGNKVRNGMGGGVFITPSCTFKVSGTPVIDNNYYYNKTDTAKERNAEFKISTGNEIKVTGSLTEGAKIGVFRYDDGYQDYKNDYAGKFTDGYNTYNSGTAPSTYFFSDSGWGVKLTEDEAATVEYVPLTDPNGSPTISITRDGDPVTEDAPRVGDLLTVTPDPENAGPSDKLQYNWYRGDELIDETDNQPCGLGEEHRSYTLTAADVGSTIKVNIEQIEGSVSTGIPDTTRSQLTQPTAVVMKKVAETLSEDDARTKADINYLTEKSTPLDGYEVSTDSTSVATSPVSLTDTLNGTSPKIYVRSKETADTAAGEWVEVTLAERPDAPTGLTTEDATDGTTNDGIIKGTTDLEYKLKGSTSGWTEATATETTVKAGTYLVRVKATESAPAGKTAEVTVGVKPMELTDAQKPTKKEGLIYNGSAQELVSAPTDSLLEGYTMKYAVTATDAAPAVDAYTYTNDSLPTGTNAGTYYVWYKAFGDDDHNDSDPGCIPVTIAQKTDLTGVSAVQKENETLVYDGTSKTPTIIVKDGDATLTKDTDYTVKYVGVDPTEYEEIATAPTSAGNYKAVITFKGNYDDSVSKDVEFTISKADMPELTDEQKPAAKTGLKYTGSAQELVTAPSELPKGYKGVQYSTDNGTKWTTTIPAGTEAGDYKVKVKYIGDENHKDFTSEDDIDVSIAPMDALNPSELTAGQKPAAKTGLKYTGSAQGLVTVPSTLPTGYTKVQYSIDDGAIWTDTLPTGINAGDYTVKVKYEGDKNHTDIEGADIETSIGKADQAAPAAPTKLSASINSVTLTPAKDYQYKCGTGDWQDSNVFTGLTKGTEYTFFQRIKGDANHEDSPSSSGAVLSTSDHTHEWSYTADKGTITATCADTDGGHGETKTSALVLNKPALTVYGGTGSKEATVTGSIEGVDNPAIVYKEGDKILTAAPTDAGTYTANITLGDVTASMEYTIVKAAAPVLTDEQKPAAVTGVVYDGVTHALVTEPADNVPDGYTLKFSTDNGTTWTTEIPTEATAGDYTVKVKYEGDKNHADIEGADINVKIAKQSQEALDEPVTTKASSAEAADGTVSPVDNTMEYSLDGENWTAVTPDAEGKAMLPAGEYSLRKKGDNNHEPSNAVSFTIGVKEEQTAPDKANITVTNASDEKVSDGKITGVDDTMEYSAEKDTEWTPVDTGKTVIENLSEGDYEIRKKGDEDHNPSESVKVTIGVTSRTQGVVEFKNKEGSSNAETGVKSAESSNIDAYAEKHFETGKDVKLKLEVIPVKEENVAEASVTGTKNATEKLFAAIDKTMVSSDYIEIDLAKYVDSAKTGNISDTGTPLEIELDYDTNKVKSVPVVVRTHNGTTKVFERLSARPASNYKDATYYAENGKVYLYSQYFSDFALVYAKLKSYYVTIDTGVGEPTVSLISEGSGIALPENPAKDGYNFRGWYTDPDGKTAWDKDKDKVSKDLNIYAGWDKAVTGVTATVDKDTLANAGDTAQISVVISPSDAANKKVSFTSSDTNVATVDADGKITAVANGTAVITVTTEDGAKTTTVTITVKIDDAAAAATVIEVKDNVIKDDPNSVAMNSGFKLDQTASKLKVAWGRVKEADGYELYVTYCGTKFGKAAKEIKNNKITSATITKINGKKLNLKKNYKLYIAAYKLVDGNKVRLANTIVGHVVGRKNTKYTNVRKVTVKKSKYTIKVGKTAKIKAKTVLVQKGKKQLSNAHAAQFRYLSINKDVATVNKNGKIKGIAAGTTTIYVYARNGYAKKIKVTVK